MALVGGMNFGIIQGLLLVVYINLSVSSDIEKVKPRWIYSNNKNSNSEYLPDSIQVDLELESGKVTLNLIKQAAGSTKQPPILTNSEGSSSIWKISDDEFLGKYNDFSLDASATVTIKKVHGIEEIYYMITFAHGDKLFSLGPSEFFINSHKFNILEELTKARYNKDINRNNNSNDSGKPLSIDGVLHSLYETPSAKYNVQPAEGFMKHIKNGMRMKRTNGKIMMNIEIFTLIDYSIFKTFLGMSKALSDKEKSEDAKKSIRYLFTHILEEVKNNYEKIEMNEYKFTTTWVGAFIAEKASDLPFFPSSRVNDKVDCDEAISGLQGWIINGKRNKIVASLPSYDFLAAFTSEGLVGNGKLVFGVTNFKSICQGPEKAISVMNLEYFFYTTFLISHELGHVLGSRHDGEDNDCKSVDHFYMKKGYIDVVPKTFSFSKCSVVAIERAIKDLIMPFTKMEWYWNCMWQPTSNFNSGRERNAFLSLYPGQMYEPDDQCKIANGPLSSFSAGKEGNEFCRNMVCNRGKSIRAMDGTTCSDGAWCQTGECVADSRAARAPNHRIYDSRKSEILLQKPYVDGFCQYPDPENPKSNGCEDTIKECSTLEPRDCYYDYYASSCCKTCCLLIQNPLDVHCLYGDKGTGCSDLVPEICNIPSRYCCESCATHQLSSNTSCEKGDYRGALELLNVWGHRTLTNCKQLIKHDSNFCQNSAFRKHCCASCKSLRKVKNYCRSDNVEVSSELLPRKLTCRQIVEEMPSLCMIKEIKDQCCKSCRFTIRPMTIQ